MLRPIYVPKQLKDKVRSHIENAIEKAKSTYFSAYEKEDTLTGHIFSKLEMEEQTLLIEDPEIGGTWKWEIAYKTFGGGGKGSTESVLGADGIFELTLQRDNAKVKKSLLFQSKVDWKTRDARLYKQCAKMLVWRGAAVLINYTPEDFETFDIVDILQEGGSRPPTSISLENLLGNTFLNCEIGDNDLLYDAFAKKLIWLDQKNEYVSTQFTLHRRLQIKITAPKQYPFEKNKITKKILNSDVTAHPLMTGVTDRYSPQNVKTLKELQALRRNVSKAFHPDKHPTLPPQQQTMINNIMRDYNAKIDKEIEKIKLKKSKY
jgi:hypothetical protein